MLASMVSDMPCNALSRTHSRMPCSLAGPAACGAKRSMSARATACTARRATPVWLCKGAFCT
eukprot:9441575-Heterocapsa_arctica.AAC.1